MLLKIQNTESVSREELEMILTTEDEAFVQELYRQGKPPGNITEIRSRSVVL